MAGPAVAPAVAGEAEPGSTRRPDLRLLPFAAGLWVGLAAVLATGAGSTGRLAGPVLLVSGLVLLARLVARGRAAQRSALVATVALIGLGLGAALGGLHLARLHPPELQRLVDQRAVVTGLVQVTGDPRASRPNPPRTDPSWSVQARLTELVARGERVTLRVPVLLRGDAVEGLAYGSVVEVSGRATSPWSAHSTALELRLVARPELHRPPGPIARATNAVREHLRDCVRVLPPDAGALLLGLAVGDESTVSPELDEAMLRAGLAHLTAVSGANTTLVLGLVHLLTRLLGMSRRARILLPAVALAAYVELVRPQPSVLRAAAMGAVALLAFSTGTRRAAVPALFGAVIVLLILAPAHSLSVGFALSTAATAALVLVAAPVSDRLRRWPVTRRIPEPVLVALAAATAAQLATLPLAVMLGNGVSLVAIPANVAVTPLVPPATILGLGAALVVTFLPGVATALSLTAAPCTAAIAWIAHTAAGRSHAVLPVPGGSAPALVTLAVLMSATAVGVAAARWRRGRQPGIRRRVVALAASIVFAAATASAIGDRRWPPGDWTLLACDVGQGDAVLLRGVGSTSALLVDTGPDPRALGSCLADSGAGRLAIVLTHLHADHIGGLAAALATGRVDMLLVPQLAGPAHVLADVRRRAAAHGVPVRSLAAGDVLMPAPGIRADVLWPARPISEEPENNGSVVLAARIDVAGAPRPLTVLLTGDIEEAAQSRLLATPPPGADVVKVPHHGSRFQLPTFADWTGAWLALVTVGRENDYGHPAASTIEQYQRAGALVARTDLQGAVAVSVRAGRPVLSTQR